MHDAEAGEWESGQPPRCAETELHQQQYRY